MFFHLAAKSLLNRKGSVILTVLAFSISMLVMFGVEHIREQAKSSFTHSVSGVDLIIGTRTGELNLLLYSVFRMGKPTNNMDWQSYIDINKNPLVSWSIPLSLGDSHRGFRVLGTTTDYFEHFSYGSQQPLKFINGKALNSIFDVVIGSQVAQKLNYQVGDKLTLSHGIGSTSFTNHDDIRFQIVGILQATGTAVDQTLHVSLQGLEAVHLPKEQRKSLIKIKDQTLININTLQPKSVTAVMVGLKSRVHAFKVQRQINTSRKEPLMAILPGIALAELWQTLSTAENTLRIISFLVIVSTLFGLSAMLLTSIRERQQEIKLLRMIGASPYFIYWLIEVEALLITLISTVIALSLLTLSIVFSKHYLLNQYGLSINVNIFTLNTLSAIGILILLTVIAAFPPSLLAFKEAKNHKT